VLWGLGGFAAVAAYCLLTTLGGHGDTVGSLLLCAVGLATGVLARDTYLSSQVTTRERKVLAEFPVLAELLALAVAAGESPVAALDRVVRRSGGELSRDLASVLAAVRTGEPVAQAFDRLAAATGVPSVARFAQGVAVAVERGTPLADVLHAQAADVREAGRRELIEVAARKEVLMMVPVVFLVLPVTVLIAFWPGVIGLHLAIP
jgi:tight adherence protein C